MSEREQYIEVIQNIPDPPSYPWPFATSLSSIPIPYVPDVEVSFKKTPIDEAVQGIKDAAQEVRDAQYSVGKGIWEDR